jgi:hypothetical protein
LRKIRHGPPVAAHRQADLRAAAPGARRKIATGLKATQGDSAVWVGRTVSPNGSGLEIQSARSPLSVLASERNRARFEALPGCGCNGSEKHSRRTRGDDALSSTAALIKTEYLAKSASNSAMNRRSGGREFKSTLLHHPVSRFSDIAENRSKSAPVRAICDQARPRRTPRVARIAKMRQKLSGHDFAGSM